MSDHSQSKKLAKGLYETPERDFRIERKHDGWYVTPITFQAACLTGSLLDRGPFETKAAALNAPLRQHPRYGRDHIYSVYQEILDLLCDRKTDEERLRNRAEELLRICRNFQDAFLDLAAASNLDEEKIVEIMRDRGAYYTSNERFDSLARQHPTWRIGWRRWIEREKEKMARVRSDDSGRLYLQPHAHCTSHTEEDLRSLFDALDELETADQ